MTDLRRRTQSVLEQLILAPEGDLPAVLNQHLTADTLWDIAFPINRLRGVEAVLEGLILPLRRALSGIHRRDEIFIGGRNSDSTGDDWVASVNHYVGNFCQPIAGIAPSNSLVFLRAGEFYRIEKDRIIEAKLIIDFLDLMRQAKRFPLPAMLGTEMLFPSPATHDGVFPEHPENSPASLRLVNAMLSDLIAYDAETFSSKGQTGDAGYWHKNMLWYGPAGIGSSYRWEGFVKDHREPFLKAFPDRVGGDHYCRIADGNYVAVGGWPSMSMTHQGSYLGEPPSGKKLTLRVMDFYRCADNKIMENWVLLDYLHLFHQMGVNLLERSATMHP
ncbi:MAG: ester cyclase [Cellvibrionales bacterium]|nr:ester cyclase [Cellvibrionales bacterium]